MTTLPHHEQIRTPGLPSSLERANVLRQAVSYALRGHHTYLDRLKYDAALLSQQHGEPMFTVQLDDPTGYIQPAVITPNDIKQRFSPMLAVYVETPGRPTYEQKTLLEQYHAGLTARAALQAERRDLVRQWREARRQATVTGDQYTIETLARALQQLATAQAALPKLPRPQRLPQPRIVSFRDSPARSNLQIIQPVSPESGERWDTI